MKKFLLSIFAVMLAVFSVQAEEVTKSVTFSNYTAGTQYAVNEKHDLGDGLVIYTTECHFTGELRIYSSSTHNGYVVSDALPGTITKMTFNAGNKVDNLDIYGSNDGTTWTNVGQVAVTSTSYKDYSFDFSGSYTRFKLDVAGSNQVRIKSMSVTYTTAGGEGGNEGGETPVVETVATPVITPESTTFNEGESLFVAIETETEDAEIYYTLDGTEPSAENGELYEDEIELTETTTVKAIAVKEGCNDSEVAEATFTAIDPSAASFKIVASELGIANGVAVESLTFGNVTATFGKGSNSNAPKYYSSGTAIRCYGGNTITFTGANGVTITGIELTYGSSDGSNAITANCGTFSTNTWTGASNEVVLTIGGTSGNRRIAAIKVSYSVGENVVVIATPSITASTSFVGSTTVEITNNEEGATLYYSTNGVDYDVYTTALNITETTTVYAKAVDAQGNESAVAEATYTKIEVLSIAEAKAAYDDAGANVDVAVDLTGAVVTVNSGQYLFIENETTGINLYNSGADYAVGTKFTAGYILGTSTVYGKMHQITGAEFNNVETTTVTVEPTEVEVADLAGNNAEWEGRFVKLSGVSVNVAAKTITQGDDTYALYNRFALELSDAAMCDIEGIVAIYNTTEQLYITKVTPFHTLSVTNAGWATLFLDFNAAIPAEVDAYAVTEIKNGYVTLTEVEGVLPANTGVLVNAAQGNYTFNYAAEATANVEGNLLEGTVAATEISAEAYVLSIVDGNVGLYKAEMAGGVWLNNANKAYLPASVANGAASYSFRFEGGTTGVENVEVENEVKVIYDLTGRQVNAVERGIYIINGKKVLVK